MISVNQKGTLQRVGSLSSFRLLKSEKGKVAEECDKIKSYLIRRRWDKLRKYLLTEEGICDLIKHMSPATSTYQGNMSNQKIKDSESEATHESDDEDVESDSSLSLLFLACQNHPPLDIIQRICAMNPKLVEVSRNFTKQTALHVVAAFGAHQDVVAFLTNLNPDHASIIDVNGRTPLHLHCERCCAVGSCDPTSFTFDADSFLGEEPTELFEEDFNPFMTAIISARGRTSGPIPDVIDTLIVAYPEALVITDYQGKTPLSYCLENGAPPRVSDSLQELSKMIQRTF